MGYGFNGTRKIIDIAANGTLTPIVATGPVRFVEVKESLLTADGAPNVAQGFEYKLPNDKFTQLLETAAGGVMEIGDSQAKYTRHGILLGNGPDTPGAGQPAIPATVLFEAQSLTATATSLEVTQYY